MVTQERTRSADKQTRKKRRKKEEEKTAEHTAWSYDGIEHSIPEVKLFVSVREIIDSKQTEGRPETSNLHSTETRAIVRENDIESKQSGLLKWKNNS